MATRVIISGSRALSRAVRTTSRAVSKPFIAPTSNRSTHLRGLASRSALWRPSTAAPHRARLVTMAAQPSNYPYAPLEAPVQPENVVSVSIGTPQAPASYNGDLLAIGVFEDAFEVQDDKPTIKSQELKDLDASLNGALSDIVSIFSFKGAKGSSQAVRAGGSGPKFVALVGLGKIDKADEVTPDWGASVWQSFGNAIAATAKANKAKSAGVHIVGGSELSDTTKAAAAGKVAHGIINGAYESTRFKNKPTPSPLESTELLFLDNSINSEAANESIKKGVALARGALLTRFLVEAPPNVCTPTHLAEAAAAIAAGAPNCFKLEILEKEQCEALGMGLYLGVAEASKEAPKFIHLKYSPPNGQAAKRIAIVGKGLTFDSGGYNLKAGAGSMIEMMKFDMGGAGSTLGAARAIADLKPANVQIHFIIASCENMVDGRGLRPGDILVASNGKTVEVNNTDAEGRLTLADALLYAQSQGAEAIVDTATLTGACMIALGGSIAGMYASTDKAASIITQASKSAGEKLWRMPLEESYMEQLKSPVADYKNTGGRMGGSITAALFLKEFVDTDKVEWVHIDQAGPVWDDKAGGATGYGAATLAEWCLLQGERS